jgi:hypothetical protein
MSEEALGLRPHSLELARVCRVQVFQRPPSAARGGGTGLPTNVVGGAIATVIFYVRWQRLRETGGWLGVQTRLDLWGHWAGRQNSGSRHCFFGMTKRCCGWQTNSSGRVLQYARWQSQR